MIFPVAAFRPRSGESYDCYIRLRGKIIETIPVFKLNFRKDGIWAPDTIVNPYELELQQTNGRWQCRHPETGQFIRVFDVELEADASGKAIVHKGQLVLRPAQTRTFWLMGDAAHIGKVAEHAIEVMSEDGKDKPEEFNQAPLFLIMGKWRSPWECIGDPTGGYIEVGHAKDQAGQDVDFGELYEKAFRETLETMIKNFTHWRGHVFLPALHPDHYVQDARYKAMDPAKQEKLEEIASTTRTESDLMIGWVRRWADFFLADIKMRRAVGMPLTRKLPQPAEVPGGNPRRAPKKILVNMTQDEVETALFTPAKEPMQLRRKPVAPKPAPPAPPPAASKRKAPTEAERQAELAGRKTRKREKAATPVTTKPVSNGTTLGDQIGEKGKALMESVVNGNGKHAAEVEPDGPTDEQQEIAAAEAALLADKPKRNSRRRTKEAATTE
jgi:hypothetical protein